MVTSEAEAAVPETIDDEENGESVPLLQRKASKMKVSSRLIELSVRAGGSGSAGIDDILDGTVRMDAGAVTSAGPNSTMQQPAESEARIRSELLNENWIDN